MKQRNIKQGDLFLLLKEKITKLDWPIAVVEEVIFGRDGKARSAVLRRPINCHKITDKGKAMTQHIKIVRGIENISLLEGALDETPTSKET